VAESWLWLSIASIGVWGVWGIVNKFASTAVGPKVTFLLGTLGALLMGLVALAFMGVSPARLASTEPKLFLLAASTGLIGAGGALLEILALSRGKASIIIPLIAVYPVITAILAMVFLGERIALHQGLGILLAVAAAILLAI
jgi:uncharacterized membrane protein